MMLGAAIEIYVAACRAVGARFFTEARVLRAFVRAAGNVPLATITTARCRSFCDCGVPPTASAARRYQVLRGLWAFAISRGMARASPLPSRPPRVLSTFKPHIYSIEELRRLFDATDGLSHPTSPLQPLTFRTLLLLLYGAGLRAGEALRLRLEDVDLETGLLRIRDTKFFKSRDLPIGSALCTMLRRYGAQRRRLARPLGECSAFFATRTGRPLSLDRLERVFRRLRRDVRLLLPHAGRRAQPRLHDLRHSFAVHRLLEWYRDGADVQQRLPWLSTYLGHRKLVATQIYLSLTPAVLDAAATRFARYANFDAETSR
jgi:site-specific recombinase XerD